MEPKHILIADDDSSVRDLLRNILTAEGYGVGEAKSGNQVLQALASGPVDLLLMDIRMPDLGGMEVLQRLKEQGKEIGVLMMTAYGSSTLAIRAIQLGAYDYITKPFELDDVLLTIRRYFEHQSLAAEVRELRTRVAVRDPGERIVGQSNAMLAIYKTIGRVAQSDATVMISGETGTGKELVAEILHQNSSYRQGPLIKVACASLPETLLESELFGHEKGSFTSAVTQRKGRFELAHKGSIFLDEIGEMTLGTQKKLLRVLQEKEFERVGGSTPIRVDVRVIAATNRNLFDEVQKGNFREDLYYRLNVIAIQMPPLRERMDDLPLLVEHFLDKHRLTETSAPAKISEEAMSVLERHDWPGNVRELENTIARAVVLARGTVITSQHLVLSPTTDSRRSPREVDLGALLDRGVTLTAAMEQVEKQIVNEALRRADGVESEAARILGVDLDTLASKLRQYGLGPESRAA